MRFVKALLLLVVFFFGLLFFVQNSEILGQKMALRLDLYLGYEWTSIAVPFYFIVIVAFAAGMLLGILYLFLDRMRLYCELRTAKKNTRVCERELAALRESCKKTAPLSAGLPGDAGDESAGA